MGDMAEYYDERTDDSFEERERPKPIAVNRRRTELVAAGLSSVTNHYPKTDFEVQEIITALDHWVWTTTKARKYSVDPYRLYADIGEVKHIIHIPGRFGGSLSWLKGERDKRLRPQQVVEKKPSTEHGVGKPAFPMIQKSKSRGVVYACSSDLCDYNTGIRKEQAAALLAITQHVATKNLHKGPVS